MKNNYPDSLTIQRYLEGKLDPEKDYRKDEKCIRCHTTGYKKEGGYVDVESTPELVGVGCEMCQGQVSTIAKSTKE